MTIRLIDGTSIESSNIRFDPATYHFFGDTGTGEVDLTNNIRRADKRLLVPEFDDSLDNLRLFNEGHPDAPPTGSTSVLGNFWEQVTTDPFAAPLESAENALARAANKIKESPMLATAVLIGAVLTAAYLYRTFRR